MGYIPALTKIDQRGQLDQDSKQGYVGYIPALTKIDQHGQLD